MTLVNVTEVLVRAKFEEAWMQDQIVCKCEQCRDDILALTLNRLLNRYVSTEEGHAYVKAQFLNRQLQSDIIKELTKAAEQVGKQPQHAVAL